MKILLLNGANMNMLGRRNVELYGSDTLEILEQNVMRHAETLGAQVICRHSNCEGELIDIMQQTDADCVVLNAGAYSHYSYAIRDCIECLNIPVVEVHMTDVSKREDFRKTDVLRDVCANAFVGKGAQSYLDAVSFAVRLVENKGN